MPLPASADVTSLLVAWSEGDDTALALLVPKVYAELHRLAHHHMRAERPGRTLQTTALVNEAYLRLVDTRRVRWQSRAHFLGVAAQAMRRILVDAARARGARKRGGAGPRVSLDESLLPAAERGASLVALDDALTDAGERRPAQEPGGGTAVLRGSERGGDRGGAGRVCGDGAAGLAGGEGLAPPRVVGRGSAAMTAERWQQIERVYLAALAIDEAGRAAMLDEACASDAELRREVETLLAQEPHVERFLESRRWLG